MSADVSFDKVATVCRGVRLAKDDVSVDSRLLILERNVAGEREHLDLLVDGNVSISFRAPLMVVVL